MKFKITIVVLLASLCLSNDKDANENKGVDRSLTIGFLSEKIPLTIFDFSILRSTRKHSEMYGTFSYLVFGGSLGLGYKYYTKNKYKSSMFVSTCAHYSVLGDGLDIYYGISIAPGYSIKIKRNPFLGEIVYRDRFGQIRRKKEYKKHALNIGLSLTHMFNQSESPTMVIPFINVESRF